MFQDCVSFLKMFEPRYCHTLAYNFMTFHLVYFISALFDNVIFLRKKCNENVLVKCYEKDSQNFNELVIVEFFYI